jgi:quinol monooxygenase YgiN
VDCAPWGIPSAEYCTAPAEGVDDHHCPAELTAVAGRRDEFADVARALAKASADEPGTVRYDWYQDADPADFVVIEEYVDSAAAFAHNAHCEELLSRVGEPAEMTAVQPPRRTEPRTQRLGNRFADRYDALALS